MSSPYDLDEVRAIAEQYSYTEIDWNRTSRVISFRKESVRINVYYTTRTVGTCLNHPARGKTQLFRREVPMDQLEQIFENPRSHTGKGYYYRQNVRQQWKTDDGSFTSDMARRWLYVCSSAGLSQKSADLDILKRLMDKITAILWEPGVLPAISYTRASCGSQSALEDVLLQVAQYDGATGYVDLNSDERELVSEPGCTSCAFYSVFCQDESNRVGIEVVTNLLLQLPRKLRMQVCNWLLGLVRCGHAFVKAKGFAFVEDDVCDQAHKEYSELAYPKKEVHKFCKLHGILYSEEE